MPKIQIVTDPKTIARHGGDRMYFAPPLDYDKVMKTVPRGKVITVGGAHVTHLGAPVDPFHQLIVVAMSRLALLAGPEDIFGRICEIPARKIGRRIGLYPCDAIEHLEIQLVKTTGASRHECLWRSLIFGCRGRR